MRLTLFNEYEAMNELGIDIGTEIHAAINPIFKKHSAAGVSLRDIGIIATMEVTASMSEEVLVNAIGRRKKEISQ